MANINGEYIASPPLAGGMPGGFPGGTWDVIGTGGVAVSYKMQGVDPDCGILTYRTWVVIGAPDFTGSQYSGPRCGVSPLTNVIVAATH